MKNFMSKFVFVFVLPTLLLQTAKSQAENQTSTWYNGLNISKSSFETGLSPEDKKQMETLWNEIGEDLKTEQNELAGTYVEGGYGSGYFLRWSSKKGFILIPLF